MKKLLFVLAFLLASYPARAAKIQSPEFSVETPKVAHVIGEITEFSLIEFIQEMKKETEPATARIIIIDSPGGDVQAGQNMIGLIKDEQAQGIKEVCIVREMAASMAFDILTVCDVRLAYQSSRLLFHKIALGGVPGDVRLTAKELRKIADKLEDMDAPFDKVNAEALHMSMDEYNFYADKDLWWMPGVLTRIGYLNGTAEVME